jgi:hypothetical protein
VGGSDGPGRPAITRLENPGEIIRAAGALPDLDQGPRHRSHHLLDEGVRSRADPHDVAGTLRRELEQVPTGGRIGLPDATERTEVVRSE